MKKFNTFKIWFGKKLINLGFGILLAIDERHWNPKKECYTGSIKQFKYAVGSWLVKQGISLETKTLNKEGWPGYKTIYFDPTFYLGNNPYKAKKRRKKNDGPDFNNMFKDWQ
jgi:hypothetical protein